MRAIVRPGLIALMAMGVLAAALRSHAQATKAAAPASGAAARPAAAAANPGQVLALVNNDKITRSDLLDFLSRYEIPDGDRELIYRDALDTLINMRLISQFLDRQNIPVSQDRVDAAVTELENELKADGTSLAQKLVESNKSLAEVKREYANRIRWIDYVKLRGTDAELKKFAESHKDLLSGTQVRASHILLRLDPNASTAAKEQTRQKLLSIKRDIEAGKMTFAQAANKFSEDPANKTSDDPAKAEYHGGDIGYFGLKSGIVEEFGKAAFALKKGQISDPVETPYGFHLIQVTDRQERPQVNFEQNKPLILNEFAAELQRQILSSQRKVAKVEIKSMPPDIFPPQPPATNAAAPDTAPAGQPKPYTAQPK